MAEPIRLLIVDDHAVVRVGLSKIFEREPGVKVIGEAIDGAEAINRAIELKPDVILMDIFLPRVTGLEAMAEIKKQLPDTRVIILTVSQREEDLFEALRQGAEGYLLKSAMPAEMVDAVRKCAAGESVLSSSLAGKLVKEFRQMTSETPLSNRETEVLQLLADGLSNIEISQRLFISQSTVRTYLRRLFQKLHMSNRVQVATYAHQHLMPPQTG